MLASLGASPEIIAALCTPEMLASLGRGAWPGNVRELRNYLERCLAFEEALPIEEVSSAVPPEKGAERVALADVPYAVARRRALDAFEQAYVRDLLARHAGKVLQAAAAAEIDRVYLYKLAKRHGSGTTGDR